jgi:membrane protein
MGSAWLRHAHGTSIAVEAAAMGSANHVDAPIASSPRPHHSRFDFARGLKRAAIILKEAGVRWVDDGCYRMGASLAYYAIFSIFPLLLVAVTALGFFLGDDPSTRERVVSSVSHILSPQFRQLLDETLANLQAHESARGVSAAIAVVTIFFGASGAFAELDTALNKIWRVKAEPSAGFTTALLRALRDKAIAFAAVAGAGAALLMSLLVSTALAAFSGAVARFIPDAILWRSIDALVSIALATLVFALVFRTLPRTHVAWRDVLGGAFFTALLFSVLKHLLAWYLGHVGGYAAYGAVGAVLGLLTWIYLVSLVMFFGAEMTRVYAEREGSFAKQRAREASNADH